MKKDEYEFTNKISITLKIKKNRYLKNGFNNILSIILNNEIVKALLIVSEKKTFFEGHIEDFRILLDEKGNILKVTNTITTRSNSSPAILITKEIIILKKKISKSYEQKYFIQKVLKEIIEKYSEEIKKNNIEISIHLSNNLPMIVGNKDLLKKTIEKKFRIALGFKFNKKIEINIFQFYDYIKLGIDILLNDNSLTKKSDKMDSGNERQQDKKCMTKILMIENNIKLGGIIKKDLLRMGYRAFIAGNILTASRYLNNIIPEIIISDILMHSEELYKFRTLISKDLRLRTIPFIFFVVAKSGIFNPDLKEMKGTILND